MAERICRRVSALQTGMQCSDRAEPAPAESLAGVQGAKPPSPEADGILVLEHTFFCAVLELVVVADLTEAEAYI